MQLWDRIDDVRAQIDVLEHPFYVRWSAGELTRDELALYAGEYRHAVVALARCSADAALDAPALREHADEEAAHVELWDRFAAAVGTEGGRAPLPQTAACAAAWAGGSTLLERLVGMYAIEASQPAISLAKLEGLRTHYGLDTPDATAYFELHADRDVEHAAAGRALIQRLVADAETVDQDALVARAEAVLNGNWLLLDGVDQGSTSPRRIA